MSLFIQKIIAIMKKDRSSQMKMMRYIFVLFGVFLTRMGVRGGRKLTGILHVEIPTRRCNSSGLFQNCMCYVTNGTPSFIKSKYMPVQLGHRYTPAKQ